LHFGRALHARLLSSTVVCADPAPSTPTPTFASAACTFISVASSPHQRPDPSQSPLLRPHTHASAHPLRLLPCILVSI
jgi:hypothetical protein